MSVLGVIPARLGATRLPRKPLRLLLGVPLVVRVWKRAQAMTVLDRVVVATDSGEVAEVCHRAGAEVLITSSEHPSGSDRVRETAIRVGAPFDVIVNIQGDEPLVAPDAVRGAVSMVERGFQVGTCATPIGGREELLDASVVKVVRTGQGGALYFSRAPIPFRREGFNRNHRWRAGVHLRHVGVYAYRRSALERWAELEPSPLEMEEGLEQLRALENGMTIGVALVEKAARGVDTPEDLARMENRLREEEASSKHSAATDVRSGGLPRDTPRRGKQSRA